jgi:hypothetical protein
MSMRGYKNSMDKDRKIMKVFGTLFVVIWAFMFVGILGMWALSGYLQYQCYASQDPNSFACWYVSDRVEVGVRNR